MVIIILETGDRERGVQRRREKDAYFCFGFTHPPDGDLCDQQEDEKRGRIGQGDALDTNAVDETEQHENQIKTKVLL